MASQNSPPNDEANRDRMDKLAADWASKMLFSEPIKVLAAVQAASKPVAWLLVLIMFAQMLGYLVISGRIGAHGGYVGIEWLEKLRFAAVAIYMVYIAGFIVAFCV